jgi:uncharacterized protein YlxW (UPF0749 family)
MTAAARLRGPLWRIGVPAVCLLAGFGFAVSAHESHGTSLRASGNANLPDLVRAAEAQVHSADRQFAALQAQVSALTAQAGKADTSVAAAQARLNTLAGAGGLTAESGPGIQVVLDDAPESVATANVDPNELVVHQSDLQAVVNALWAGGAEAMTIAGQRVVATSAVRCVGNTLLLNGEVFSPPFRVAAIGPYRTMKQRLDSSPGVKLFVQAAGYYGLGYTVESVDRLGLPPFVGSVGLSYAHSGSH